MSGVELRSLEKRFGAVSVLSDLSLDIRPGEYLVLLGPSGSGKTTVLNVISGLIGCDSGTVMIGGRDVTGVSPRRRGVAMVFQNDSMYPHLTIGGSLSAGLPRALTAADRQDRIGRAIELVQFPRHLLERKPAELSGGQLRRAAVAKAIASQAPVRLFDEPLAALDAAAGDSIQRNLREIHQHQPTTTIHVTHDGDEAVRLADRIAVIDEGRILQVGTASELYRRPAHRRVADSLGTPPICYITVAGDDLPPDVAQLLGLPSALPGRRMDVGVRAEFVRFVPLDRAAFGTGDDLFRGSAVNQFDVHEDDPPRIGVDAVATSVTPSMSAVAGLMLEVEFALTGPLRRCSQSTQTTPPSAGENTRGTASGSRIVAALVVRDPADPGLADAVVGQRFNISMSTAELSVFDSESGCALRQPSDG